MNPPFGELEYEPIVLEPDNFYVYAGKARRPERWCFIGFSREHLEQVFNQSDLSSAQRGLLLNTNCWEPLTNGYALPVSDALVLGLSHAACQRLFPLLGRDPANYYESTPFRFPLNSFDECFGQSGIAPEKLEMVRRLTYTNWGQLCFCATEHFRASFTTNEFESLLKVLYRAPTFILRLRVTPQSNIDALLSYWAPGERARELRPLFESLERKPDGGVINISRLLPGFARLRLYTYPDPLRDSNTDSEDCFYSALNFFNDGPNARLLDDSATSKALRQDFYVTDDGWTFGDLLLLTDSSGTGIHCCVYLADQVVFTKNGGTYLQPWKLMKIPDLLTSYTFDKAPNVIHLRRKGAARELHVSSL